MNRLFTFFRQGRFRLFPRRSTSPASVFTGQMPQSAPADPYPGRELIFTLIREYLTMQHQVADQHNAKASGILVGGTTMVGFAFLIQHHPVGNCSDLFPIWLHRWPIQIRLAIPYGPFLLCYAFSMIFAILASRVRELWAIPGPVQAWKSLKKPEQELKLELSQSMAHFAKENELVLNKKADWVQRAGYMLLWFLLTLFKHVLVSTDELFEG